MTLRSDLREAGGFSTLAIFVIVDKILPILDF
jgi:hypothetical protein